MPQKEVLYMDVHVSMCIRVYIKYDIYICVRIVCNVMLFSRSHCNVFIYFLSFHVGIGAFSTHSDCETSHRR